MQWTMTEQPAGDIGPRRHPRAPAPSLRRPRRRAAATASGVSAARRLTSGNIAVCLILAAAATLAAAAEPPPAERPPADPPHAASASSPDAATADEGGTSGTSGTSEQAAPPDTPAATNGVPEASGEALPPIEPAVAPPAADAPRLPREKPEVPDGFVRVLVPPKPGDAAKYHFGRAREAAPLAPEAIGGYSRGCLAGAEELAADGPGWQAMRPSRNRAWGHPSLIAFLQDLAAAAPGLGWHGLLVGDLAQPRGGPMLTGHASHQIGLDADIWLTPMPGRRLAPQERETLSAVSMLDETGKAVDRALWTEAHTQLIREAAADARVARIFVHPAIKQAVCEDAGGKGAWLARVRPWYGHHYHFHVRLKCPAGSTGCRDQPPPPSGPGCGAELAWWFTDAPYRSTGAPAPAPLTIAALPARCRAVLIHDADENGL